VEREAATTEVDATTGAMMDHPHGDYGRSTRQVYVITCSTHGDLGSAVGAFAAGRALRQHGCLEAYAEPRRRYERRRGG
jgi:hypothetical protein